MEEDEYTDDEGRYNPPPDVIRQRKSDTRWLSSAEFPEPLIVAIMEAELVTMDAVHTLVRRHGFDEAIRRLAHFLEVEL